MDRRGRVLRLRFPNLPLSRDALAFGIILASDMQHAMSFADPIPQLRAGMTLPFLVLRELGACGFLSPHAIVSVILAVGAASSVA